MYVVLEYLVYLAIVSFLGLAFFLAAALGLVAKTGATWLAAQGAEKLPKIASNLSPRRLTDLKKNHEGSLAQG
jgi:hypothetical protein